MDIILVALGGACGAVSRYLVGNVVGKTLGSALPYGTLVINVVGCFFMGLLMTAIVEKQILPPAARLLLCVGFLGGFTTFSSFGYETFALLTSGKLGVALGYAGGSVILGILAAACGVYAARLV